MKQRNNMLFAAALLSFSLTAAGQTAKKDSTLNRVVVVEKEYNPDIMDASKVNVNGGAIALGHPLGCSGTKLTVQLMHEMEARKAKYGMVTMCVGTGQGAASIFEFLK